MSQRLVFQHVPLNAPSHQFRVVAILPFQDDDTIRCTTFILQVPTSQRRYKALSYLWGSEASLKPIELDGKSFNVRDNLYRFLKHAQKRFSNDLIFIDAICIDQINIPERNQQVQMMGQIYESADVVISWLGEDRHEALDAAFPFIEEIAAKTIPELEHFYDGQDRRDLQQAWSSVYILCRLEYWQRAWIVQEILKARVIVLLYGKHELDWKVLQMFMARVRRADPCPAPLPEQLFEERMVGFVNHRENGLETEGPIMRDGLGSMRDVLLAYGTSMCSEKRDHVFAFISLVQKDSRLKVDYSMPLHELFMKTITLWGCSKGANILTLARHTVNRLLFDDKSAGPEFAPATFTLKLIEVERLGSHESCAKRPTCCTNDIEFQYYCTAGSQDGLSLPDRQLVIRDISSRAKTINFGEIKFSQLRCSDKILQVEDTCMFLVIRPNTADNQWTIVGRLVVIVDEVDHQLQTVTLWRPYGRMQCSSLNYRSGLFWEMNLNAFSLRRLLIIVGFIRYNVSIVHRLGASTAVIETVHWEDEPTGTYPYGAVEQVSDLYMAERLKPENGLTTRSLSVSQAYQILLSLKMDLTLEELPSSKCSPSWKDLLGRT